MTSDSLLALAIRIGLIVAVWGAVIYIRRRLRNRRTRQTVALHRASLDERDRRRVEQFGPSPMPAETYPSFKLEDPTVTELDDALRALAARFAAAPEAERLRIRGVMTRRDMDTLYVFATRAAVFTMRTAEQRWAEDGLRAIAMIDSQIYGTRDLLDPLKLLHHAIVRTGLDPAPLFQDASAVADAGVREFMLWLLALPDDRKNIDTSYGYKEVTLPNGIGFTRNGGD